jgi:hypothetical protein
MAQGDDRLPYLYEGEVTRRDDPDGLGRVKVLIPGVVEPETPNWAWPMASPGGGSAQRGTFEPPAVGSNVLVMFKLGERDYPYYMTGPWGEPGGVSDVPTNAAVEDADRQNAVTEDEEWRVERDSRTSGKKYLIRHKNSSQALLFDADADKLYLVRESASQAFVRGTEYRAAEVTYTNGVHGALIALGEALGLAAGWPAVVAAGEALTLALNSITETNYRTTSSEYLSEKGFVE